MARKSVEFADLSGDRFQPIARRTDVAAIAHALGCRDEASTLFGVAERMQRESYAHGLLHSLQGFQYCDLLLDQDQVAEAKERATMMLKLADERLLDIAVGHLSLGCANLVALRRGDTANIADSHLQRAVDGLRNFGSQDFLPLGLVARAALHTHTRDFPLARHDLEEALTLATRCGFRLHECDAHLGLARLALAEGPPSDPRPHLSRARTIIKTTGYHRRDAELADLERRVNENETR
jgi:hypothetical protein